MCGLLLPFGSLPAGCAVGPGCDAEGRTLSLRFDFPDTPREKGIEEICLATHIWIIRQFGIPRSAAGSPCVSFQHPSHSPGGRSDQIAGPQ